MQQHVYETMDCLPDKMKSNVSVVNALPTDLITLVVLAEGDGLVLFLQVLLSQVPVHVHVVARRVHLSPLFEDLVDGFLELLSSVLEEGIAEERPSFRNGKKVERSKWVGLRRVARVLRVLRLRRLSLILLHFHSRRF